MWPASAAEKLRALASDGHSADFYRIEFGFDERKHVVQNLAGSHRKLFSRIARSLKSDKLICARAGMERRE